MQAHFDKCYYQSVPASVEPQDSLVLQLYQGPLSFARLWLEPEQRRRDAVRAARDRDLDTLWSLVQAHHSLHTAAGSHHTLRTYRNGLRRWLVFTERHAVGLLHPKADDGMLFVRELGAGQIPLERRSRSPKSSSTDKPIVPRPLSVSSVNVYLAGARALYRALRWADATDADPFLDVRVGTDKVARWDKRSPYPQTAVEALLSTGDVRHRVTVLLGAHAGLRASEIVKLRREDLDLIAGRLKITGKGNKLRVVNLSASLKRSLSELMAQQPGHALIIGGTPEAARLRLQTVCLQIGVPFLSLHALRHSAGTRLVKSGRSLQDVARHLGHASVATAEIYAKWADESLKQELNNW